MNDEMLMRYLDGELTPAECREVERALGADAALRTKRDALLEMRDLLRARFELVEDEAAPQLGVMWERLRSALPAAPVAVPRPGLWSRARDWLDAYRSHLVTGALAAAAGALVATAVTSRLAAPGALAAHGGEVESLEVNGGTGMVFQEPPDKKGEDGATIIWVTANEPDDDDDDALPAAPPGAAPAPPEATPGEPI
jgi:anti-sigma factor RsiW